ncbi:MAG: TraM recognition domain-containing protein [Nitrososphaerales archaeon]
MKIGKPEIKKILTPKQLKKRTELSLFSSIGLPIIGLSATDFMAHSLIGGLIATGFYKYYKDKLDKTQIGADGKRYFKIGKDELGREVWINDFYFHRHMLVVGGTGMGKTSLYRVILKQCIRNNFGIIYINFKAEDEDFFNLYFLAKEEGRVEDLLLLNLSPTAEPTETATYNPLATLETPQEIADFFFNLLAPAQGDMAYWQGRGRNLMSASARVFVYLRDIKKQKPSLDLLMRAFEISEMLEAYNDPELPESFRDYIEAYLQDLDPSGEIRRTKKASKISDDMATQHGYALQQWKESLMDISFRFKHIVGNPYSDIDFKDVLKSSRILYVHMPALSLPNSTKEALGRLILAGLKTSVGAMLGEKLLGNTEELSKLKKLEKPSNPFLIIIDEHGTAPITGLDDFIRQIRSLGGGCIIADQNWDGIKQKFGDAYMNTLLGNSLTKIIMNVEGSQAVMGYLKDRLPKFKGYVPNYKKEDFWIEGTKDLRLEEEYVVNPEEVLQLGAGEGILIQKEHVLYVKFDFYVPKRTGEIKLLMVNSSKVRYSVNVKRKLEEVEKFVLEKVREKSNLGLLEKLASLYPLSKEENIEREKSDKDSEEEIFYDGKVNTTKSIQSNSFTASTDKSNDKLSLNRDKEMEKLFYSLKRRINELIEIFSKGDVDDVIFKLEASNLLRDETWALFGKREAFYREKSGFNAFISLLLKIDKSVVERMSIADIRKRIGGQL